MKPTKKSPQITRMLDELFSRTSAINSDKCIRPPVGCGGPATEFRDEISAKEYRISGLCQKCQDEIFG